MKKMGTTLTIPFVRRRSAGIYTCVATNQFGGEVKASLEVSVYGKGFLIVIICYMYGFIHVVKSLSRFR